MTVVLEDHYTGDEINAAVSRGAAFGDAFPGETAGELDALRELFRRKALIARQARLCEALLAAARPGRSRRCAGRPAGRPTPRAAASCAASSGIDASDDAPAFVRRRRRRRSRAAELRAASRAGLADRDLSLEANGGMCRSLLQVRYGIRGGGGMKAARLHEYHQALKLDEVDEPKATGPFDVVVKIGAAGLCRTDLHIQEGQWAEKSEVVLPYTPGHENAGWVHEVGSGVTNVEVGDTVIVHPFISCGLCRPCRRGDDMHCVNGSFPGINRDGGFAELLLTSARSVVKLDPSLRAGVDRRARRRRADRDPRRQEGDPGARRRARKAVVIGAGGLGHIGIQCLKAYTPTEIIVVDPNEKALALAKELGADHTVKVEAARTSRPSRSSRTAWAPRRSSTSSARRAPSRTASR